MQILSISLLKFNKLFTKYLSLDYKLMGYINEGGTTTDSINLSKGVFMRPVFNSYSVPNPVEISNYTQLIKGLYNYISPSIINIRGETISVNNSYIYYHNNLIGYLDFNYLILWYNSNTAKFCAKLCLPALKWGMKLSIVPPCEHSFHAFFSKRKCLLDIDEEFINSAFNNIIYGDLEGLGQQESV